VEAYASLVGKTSRNTEVILVNHDTSQKAMDKYLVKNKLNFPGLKLAEKENSLLTTLFKFEALPAMAITDANGKVISSGEGQDCAKVLAKMKSLAK
jgi:hypothetical protein